MEHLLVAQCSYLLIVAPVCSASVVSHPEGVH